MLASDKRERGERACSAGGHEAAADALRSVGKDEPMGTGCGACRQ